MLVRRRCSIEIGPAWTAFEFRSSLGRRRSMTSDMGRRGTRIVAPIESRRPQSNANMPRAQSCQPASDAISAIPAIEPGVCVASVYRVIRRLAPGRTGDVYGAIDERSKRPVRLEIARDDTATRRLRWVFARGAELTHPSVAGVWELVRLVDTGHAFAGADGRIGARATAGDADLEALDPGAGGTIPDGLATVAMGGTADPIDAQALLAVRDRAVALCAQGDREAAGVLLRAVVQATRDRQASEALAWLMIEDEDADGVVEWIEPGPHSPRLAVALARARIATGRAGRAAELARWAAAATDDDVVLAATDLVEAALAARRDDWAAAEARAMRGLDRVGDGGVAPALRADLLSAVAQARLERGDWSGARPQLEAAIALHRRTHRSGALARELDTLGRAFHVRGQWADALRVWGEHRLVCARSGDTTALARVTRSIGRLTLYLEGPDRALHHIDAALVLAERPGLEALAARLQTDRAEALLRIGACAEAAASLDAADARLLRLPTLDPADPIRVMRCRAEIELAAGRWAEAVEIATALSTRIDPTPADETGQALRLLAAAKRGAGDVVVAWAHARDAVLRLEAVNAPYERAEACEELARCALEAHRPLDAVTAAERAIEQFRRVDAERDAMRCEALRHQIGDAERETDRQAVRGQVLLDVAQQFGSAITLNELMTVVLDRIVRLLEADRALFAVFDAAKRVEHAVLHNLDWPGGDAELPVSRGLIDDVRRTARVVTVADALVDAHYQGRASIVAHGLRSLVGVPVLDGDRVVGVIYADSRVRPVTDPEAESGLLFAISRLVSTALANARLFEEQRFRAELLATLVHDFRSPLMVVGVNASLMLEGEGHNPGELEDMVSDISVSVQRMLRMVDDTLELSSIDAGVRPPRAESIDVARTLHEVIGPLRAIAQPIGVEIRLAARPDVHFAHTVPERIAIIVNKSRRPTIRPASMAESAARGRPPCLIFAPSEGEARLEPSRVSRVASRVFRIAL